MSGKPGGAIVGTFPSLKLGRPVRYTSSLERDILFVLEFEQAIVRYQEQPFQIEMDLPDQKTHRYTPDYAVWLTDSRMLVECKPLERVAESHSQQQIQIGTQWSADNDWQFMVVTDVDLRAGKRLENLKLLWRYSRLPISEKDCVGWQARCQQSMTVLDLAQSPNCVPVVMYLLFHHYLQADLSQPLTVQSQVWC